MNSKKEAWNTQRVRRGMALWLVAMMLINMFVTVPESKASSASDKKQIFEDSGYQLELSMSSSWESGYVAEVVVTNTGNEDIRSWSVAATMKKGDIERSWNVTNKKAGTQEVVFESESHNMTLRAGESKSFGFQVTNGAYHDIISLKLVQGNVVNTDKASLELNETSSWDGHKIYEGIITNNSGSIMRDWYVSFEAEGKVANIWNAAVTSEEDGIVYIKNCDYNAVIEAGASVTFGFDISFDTDSFDGIYNARIYASESSGSGTEEPAKTNCPATGAPTPTPAGNETTGTEEEITEDDAEFVQVENRDWNMDMIRANDRDVEQAKKPAGRKIKVTMLDSGINYSDEVDVAERRNFVEGEDEMSCLFEDGSGHGTAIAEVLASNPDAALEEEDEDADIYYGDEEEDEAEDEDGATESESGTMSLGKLLDSGYAWTEGINPNIELYSGKILDANNDTTVQRTVEGIEWAIENDTDILSLSIGMDQDSDKLHDAIKRAEASGMLIIAAVGDDEKVDYPAAYPEVMSVGMVNSMGETMGIPAEVVAPGDSIVSRGVFDNMQIFTGSSMAVPHVAGLASILWQKDTSKDAAFIRGLMDVSANPIEGDESCEYGLIDCKYALESYEAFEGAVRTDNAVLASVSMDRDAEEVQEKVRSRIDNESEVATEEEMAVLHGNWDTDNHKEFVSKDYRDKWTNGSKYVKVLWEGISFVDNKKDNPACYGMREHPWFHGFFGGVKEVEDKGKKTPKSNYMTSFRTLLELADGMRKTGKIKEIATESEYPAVENALRGIRTAFADERKIGSETWEDISGYCAKSGDAVPKDCRSLLIYGMAMHTLGDVFSHSSFGMKKQTKKDVKTGKKKQNFVWKRYQHGSDKNGEWYADNTESRKLRYKAAKSVTKRALDEIQVDSDGLAGYGNAKTPAGAFCAGNEFKKLREYCVSFSKKLGQDKKLFKMKYFTEGYVLKDFSKYYEQEVKITGKTSKNVGKYNKYVDKADVEGQLYGSVILQFFVKGLLPKSKVTLKAEGESLASMTLTDNKIAVSVSKDTEYEVVGTDAGGTFTVCTIRDGVVYDCIGRKMQVSEPEDEITLEEADEELEETENLDVCGIVNFEPSMDSLIRGTVTVFDDRISSSDNIPGLKGVHITAVSQQTGEVFETESKSDGSYQLQVPAGQYDITYEKGEKYTRVNQVLSVSGEVCQNLTVELIDEGWFGCGYMDGYLFDKTSRRPLEGAVIKIYTGITNYSNEPVDTVVTDKRGYFETALLEAGAYTFVVSKEGYITKYNYESIYGGIESYVPRLEIRKEDE